MSLLDGELAAVFGAAFAGLSRAATLTKVSATDDGSGGFHAAFAGIPVRAMVEAVSDRARAASGLPDPAVTVSVLRAGLAVAVDLDDEIAVAGQSYRVIRVDTDPAGAASTTVAVPV